MFRYLCEIEKKISTKDFIKEASVYSGYNYSKLTDYIKASIEEARHTLSFVSSYDLKNKKILEFGSGLGIVSVVLAMNNYKIISFEPGGLGFEKNVLLNRFIKNFFGLDFVIMSSISEVEDNVFDFIFSNNVLEHVPNVSDVMLKLNNALAVGGVMTHNMPNYIVPYEPHFGILFFPIFPLKMSILIPKKIKKTDLWKSLNFINIFDVKKCSRKAKAMVTFEKYVLYNTVIRIERDNEFANRHRTLVRFIKVFKKLGLLTLLKYVPVFLNTPMIFEWKKNV